MIPVMNGVLNIDTQELTPHKPEYCFFNKLPTNYNPEQDCPNIKKFLTEVLPDQESLLTLQEFYGSCLLKEYRYEKSLMLTGTGSNGKGKTLELLKYLLGIENCAEINLQAIEEDIFAIGELVNKMANISGDISSQALKNTGSFKNLTGRDLIMAARKFKTRVKFINYAKMIFSANEIPDTKDMTDGFFRRWIVIDFPYKFLDEKDRIDMSNVNPDLIKNKDPEIISKITSLEELSGFLNWCLLGYSRLKEQRDFSNNQTINKVRQIWIRKANSIQAFIIDCVEEDYDSMITRADFKMWYVAYCRRHHLKQMNDKAIRDTLTGNYNVFETRPWNEGEDRDRCWKGIRFLNFGVEK
jgi:putative DNA primase/helicase